MEVQPQAPGAYVQSLSNDYQAQDLGNHYEIPAPEPSPSFAGLKDRIKRHYEICSDYYYSLWYVLTEPTLPLTLYQGALAKYQG